jgi:hypothetical protein
MGREQRKKRDREQDASKGQSPGEAEGPPIELRRERRFGEKDESERW